MEISMTNMNDELMQIYPIAIEFPYETLTNSKISPECYEIIACIPQSKKNIGYFTKIKNQQIFIMYELNRFKKICNVITYIFAKKEFTEILSWMNGTVLYGSIVNSFFVIEDILLYNNLSLRNTVFKDKLAKMIQCISVCNCFVNQPYVFILPFILKNENQIKIPVEDIPYTIHHVQYYSLNAVKPILNTHISKSGILCRDLQQTPNSINQGNQGSREFTVRPLLFSMNMNMNMNMNIHNNKYIFNYFNPQYKKKTIFKVMADYAFDIYNLYAFNNIKGKYTTSSSSVGSEDPQHAYVDVAYIPDYNTSKLLNSIFRKIKENENLDYIEESDDEDDFENTDMNKYVDIYKKVNMECYFHFKFKKWIPLGIVENVGGTFVKIVPITNLI
jgi:hypothetical protein